MSAFRIFRIAASGLTAERLRMDTIANNLANANTTRTPEGGPYRRQVPVFAPILDRAVRRGGSPKETFSGGGVQVVGVVSDPHRRAWSMIPSIPMLMPRVTWKCPTSMWSKRWWT